MNLPGKKVARSSAGVTLLAGLTSLLGFGVQIVVARYFGASGALDSYFAGGALPMAVIGVATGGIGYVLVPLLCHQVEQEKAASDCFWTLAATMVVLCGGATLAVPALVRHSGPGLTGASIVLAEHVAYCLWLGVGFSVGSSFFTGLLHHQRKFMRAALSFPVAPLTVLSLTVILAPGWGVMGLAVAWACGSLAQLVYLVLVARPAITAWSGRWDAKAPSREFLSGLTLIFWSLLPFTAVPVVDAYWGTQMGTGSLSLASYGFRIAASAGTLLLNGAASVVFPYFSEYAARGQFNQLRRVTLWSLGLNYLIFIPIVTIAIWLRIPLLRLVFERGNFTHASTLALARVLPLYLLGATAMGAMTIVGRALYACRKYAMMGAFGVGFMFAYFNLVGGLSASLEYRALGYGYLICWNALLSIAFLYLWRYLTLGQRQHDLRLGLSASGEPQNA